MPFYFILLSHSDQNGRWRYLIGRLQIEWMATGESPIYVTSQQILTKARRKHNVQGLSKCEKIKTKTEKNGEKNTKLKHITIWQVQIYNVQKWKGAFEENKYLKK